MPISVRKNQSSAVFPSKDQEIQGRREVGREEVYDVLWVTTGRENNTMYEVVVGIYRTGPVRAIRRVNALELKDSEMGNG